MRKLQLATLVGAVAAGALLAACIPVFTDGLFQTLRLSVRLDEALAVGDERLVHSADFAGDFKVRKNFVRLSGRLTPPGGDAAPSRLTVVAEIEDPDSGKVIQRITLRLDIAADGSFDGNARLRKNVGAGERLTVTVEPIGADLAAGSELTFCVDLVKSRGALGQLPDCVAADDGGDPGGGNDPDATFSSLSEDFFGPTCSVSGCHSAGSARAGLVLEPAQAHGNLVGVRSSQRPELDRVTAGDPDNSYLVKKLRGDGDIVGQRMPQGGPFLTAGDVDRFVRWIQSGAPDN